MSNYRLISFGCSYAFGHGLPDCIGNDKNAPGRYPSRYSYPNLIAKKINAEIVNLSQPGSSNKEIAYRILNFNFEKTDIVLISWTHSERTMMILKNEPENFKIAPWAPNKKSKLYYKHFHNDDEEIFLTEIFYAFSNYFLQDKVAKIVNTPPINHYSNVEINYQKYNFICSRKTIQDFKIDYAADNSHPGIQSNREFSEYLLNNYLSES